MIEEHIAPSRLSYEVESTRIVSSYSNIPKTSTVFSALFISTPVIPAETSTSTRSIVPSVRDTQTISNRIETSKYNLFTFLPKNLMIQLSKLAHVYFLIIGIFQTINEISTTNGKPSVYLPLVLIVLVSMVKDFVEDRQRHAADKKENESVVLKLNPTTREFEKGGLYVETKNLDGETNLKRKKGASPIDFRGEHAIYYENLLNYTLKYEHPNAQMYSFNGVLNNSLTNKSIAVNIDNVCLRGSSLKLTSNIIGMVVYAGHETKILLNSQSSSYKRSRIETLMNKMILWIFLLLIVVCVFCAAYYSIWFKSNRHELKQYMYFDKRTPESNASKNFFYMIPLWILLLGNFVPISLMVTLEMVKYFQGKLLQHDKNYKNINDDDLVDVKSCNLTEELGCVNYIFTDKTGTLTVNEMNFKAISLNGVAYSAESANIHDETVYYSEDLARVLTTVNSHATEAGAVVSPPSNQQISKKVLIYTHRLHRLIDFSRFLFILNFPYHMGQEIEGINCLNLCHTILVTDKNGTLTYSGVSPDEESIMQFCFKQGCYFAGEDISHVLSIKNEHTGEVSRFKRIATLEFDFMRRKMSVIVQNLQTLEYRLYCKGADQSIFDNCLVSDDIVKTKYHLHKFATQGLRTLAFAYKPISQEQVDNFLARLDQVKQSVVSKEEALFELYQEIEQGLTLLGGTGINDRLQADVEKTLHSLKTAGIKIWMLTGDKIETATNIASQCKLISLQQDNLILDSETTATNQLIEDINRFYEKTERNQTNYSVLITGHTIYNIEKLSENDCKPTQQTVSLLEKLHTILFHSETVIASKITPKQKADLVRLVKRRDPSVTTLAIGDGANDVSMITTAHVGIGIRGKEGRQAAKVSDFSIGEFRHLNRLLLYQGYETYRKNSQLVFFNFYKNQVAFLVYLWYNFLCGLCGTFIYDQWITQLYNLFFTAMPIILYCLFDELYPAHDYLQLSQTLPNKLETMPLTYKKHLSSPVFTVKNFWIQFFKGSLQSILITIIGLMCFLENAHSNGRQLGHLEVGMVIFTFAVIIPNLKVFQLHTTHYPVTLFFIAIGIVIFVIVLEISSHMLSLTSFGVLNKLACSYNTYFSIALVIIVVFGPECAINHWKIYSEGLSKQPRIAESLPLANLNSSYNATPDKKQPKVLMPSQIFDQETKSNEKKFNDVVFEMA